MTKFIALFLSFVLFIVPVFADRIDVTSLSDDELNELYASVVSEMYKRGSEVIGSIPPGEYIVGVDISAGSYMIRYESSEVGNDWIDILTYRNRDDYSHHVVSLTTLLEDDEWHLFNLVDDMIVKIESGTAAIKTAPKSFWMIEK